jgi:hypothetical protein
MIGVMVHFQKWACVEKWRETVPKWAQMRKVYWSSSKNGRLMKLAQKIGDKKCKSTFLKASAGKL